MNRCRISAAAGGLAPGHVGRVNVIAVAA